MTDRCEDLHAYVDGELGEPESKAHVEFEAHLVTCDACNAELPRLLALLAALDTAAKAAPSASPGGPRLRLITGAPTPGAARHTATVPRPGRRRRFPWTAAGLAGALAVAAGLLLIVRRPAAPAVVSLESELSPFRHLEARLSYPGTEHYRPLDVARGSRANEPISLDRMAQLERAKDLHGLAVAALLAGEQEGAARYFAKAPATPAVASDRAALELLDGSPAALERALDDVDRALAVAPNDPPALWNRALVLAALNLPLAAAIELDHVSALGEPGWAGEARQRAQALRAPVAERRVRWRRAYDAGRRLIADGTAVPVELAGVTGQMTITLYDAVRSAASRKTVETLLPLAEILDSAYRSHRLTSYVRRIAESDFQIRKPLADSYRELALGRAMTSDARDTFLHRLAQAGAGDLQMGAMVYTGQVAAHLDDYRRLATQAQDPWFEAIVEHALAKAEISRGEIAAAERRLHEAVGFAQRERLAYRAILLETELVALHRETRRLSQANEDAQVVYREATAAGEWILEMNALRQLASINQDRYAQGLARAYLTELVERSKRRAATSSQAFDEKYDCATSQYAYQSLANVSLLLLQPERARTELAEQERASTCDEALLSQNDPTTWKGLAIQKALVWAELHRFRHRDEDARIARDSLAALRAASTLTAAEQALIAHIEGNLLIDIDPTAGQQRLREAIARSGQQADDSYAVKARAYSFSLLALNAGRASRFSEVIDLLAETLGVGRPERCAVAIAVQGERSVVAFSDARGEVGGQYVASRRSAELDARALVPAAVVDRLRACERVTVLSRAPVLGAGRLLPPELAWSYRLAGTASPADPAAPAVRGRRRVVVANPEAPADLHLPPLGPYPEQPDDPDVLVLRGAGATPSRVLQAMHDASVVEFHTHGFIANDVSEASYLVLSPELDRQYAMTAADVAQVRLDAAPLIILGACHAATSSQSLEGGMGLAEAFRRAGARAVIASPDAIQDLGAHEFFADVRERVLHGTDPAIAVRDERMRRLTMSHEDAWVAGVVVFE